MKNSTERTLKQVLTECIDPFKGLLILVVVLDHNDVAHALFPATFHPLTFHVLGFLFLPFIIGRGRLSKQFVLDRIVRYSVPQFWILTICALLLWVLHNRSASMSQVIRGYGLALIIGSGPLVKEASGFLAYWFLPTLLGLSLVIALYRSIPRKVRQILIGPLVLAHAFLVATNFPAYQWVPCGLAIAGNIFVLGLLFSTVLEKRVAYATRRMWPVIFVISYGWLVYRNAWLEVADLELAPVTQLSTFIAQDVAAVSGVISVLLLAHRFRASKAMISIGSLSLMIYIIHPLVYGAMELAFGTVAISSKGTDVSVIYGLVTYGIALMVAWSSASMIARSPSLSAWITPRGWAGWPPLSPFSAVNAK